MVGSRTAEEATMKVMTRCPNCGDLITGKRWNDQDWFLCRRCRSLFFSHGSIRDNWPVLYRKLLKDEKKPDVSP